MRVETEFDELGDFLGVVGGSDFLLELYVGLVEIGLGVSDQVQHGMFIKDNIYNTSTGRQPSQQQSRFPLILYANSFINNFSSN